MNSQIDKIVGRVNNTPTENFDDFDDYMAYIFNFDSDDLVNKLSNQKITYNDYIKMCSKCNIFDVFIIYYINNKLFSEFKSRFKTYTPFMQRLISYSVTNDLAECSETTFQDFLFDEPDRIDWLDKLIEFFNTLGLLKNYASLKQILHDLKDNND
jgi:hypothetical protein